MPHTIVTTDKAPGPYPILSQATVFNGIVYCAGTIGVDPATNTLVPGPIQARTTQCLKNLQAVLEAAGSGIDKILKVVIYLTALEDQAAMNEAYLAFLPAPRPARLSVIVKELSRGTDVEMECTGHL